MHQLIDKKKKIYFYVLFLLFLSSISNLKLNTYKENILNVKKIDIKGLSESLNNEINQSLNYLINKNIFLIDKNRIVKILDQYKYLDSYIISKKLPSNLEINLKITTPVAITIKNGEKQFLGNNGKFISKNIFKNVKPLPNIFGNFNPKDFFIFIEQLKNNDFDIEQINEYYFFYNGRWDVKYINGTIIKFPKNNLPKSIKIAKKIMDDQNEKKRIIDLRVPNQVIVSND